MENLNGEEIKPKKKKYKMAGYAACLIFEGGPSILEKNKKSLKEPPGIS